MKIKHVYGNVLRIDIPLTIKIINSESGETHEVEKPFYPDTSKPVLVELANQYNITKYTYEATIDGNVAHIEDYGNIRVGVYKVTVKCFDEYDQPYRYMVRDIIEICDATIDAGIEAGIEFDSETYTLEGAVFVSYGREQVQADWGENDTHSKAYIKNKPTNLVEDESYVHTDNNYTDAEKEKLSELENYDDTEIKQEIFGKVDKELGKGLSTNDYTNEDKQKVNSALQSETDPTVPQWAKQPNKPRYTAQEVGALPNSTKYGSTIDFAMDSATYVLTLSLKDQDGTVLNTKTVDLPIESVVVNGRYDAANKKIVLTLQSGSTIDVPVGDLIAGLQTEITNVNMLDADLVDDTNSTHKFVTAQEKANWNNKSDFSGSYNDLTDKPTIPAAQIQSDWNQSDNTQKDFIKNKPTIPAAQVNADWNADSGVAQILNKPAIPDVSDCIKKSSTAGLVKNDGTIDINTYLTQNDISGKADKSEMSVTDGTGADSDKTTIQLKSGTSATVLKSHQSLAGKQDVIDEQHKLSADLVDDSTTTNKFTNSTEKSTWNGKQDALVSGTNIKTINNESILGSGNITIQGGGSQVQSDWNQSDNTAVDYIKNKPTTMGASGSGHKGGLVPDTPSTAGTTKFLREDGTWSVPEGGGGSASAYTPTLVSAPTSSTTSYTRDGQTVGFEIGQFCRVADAGAESGYRFFQLHDLQDNGSVAVWQEIGSALERVTLSVTPQALRSSAVVTLRSAKSGVLFQGTVADVQTVKVEPGDTYTVECSDVDGYITPESTEYTAQYEGERSIPLTYEKITVVTDYIILDQTSSDPTKKVLDSAGRTYSTGYTRPAVIDQIRAASHCYVGTFANNVMTLKQLSDTDGTQYADGTSAATDIASTSKDVFMRLPIFYTRTTQVETDKWKIEFAFDPSQVDANGQIVSLSSAQPSGSGWKQWGGNDLIGKYEAYETNSMTYSISGQTSTGSVSQANFKSHARSRGTGFTIVKWRHQNVMAILFYAYYGHTNCQSLIGSGANSNNKQTGLKNSLGMTDTTSANGNTDNIVFWGLENWWGNKYEWVDNVVVNSGTWTITEDDGSTRTLTAGTHIMTAAGSWVYPSKFYLGDDLDTVGAVGQTGGSDSAGYCDGQYIPNSSSRVVARSSNNADAYGGVAVVRANNASSISNPNFGSRLAFTGTIEIS